ncbi:MAG: hypothetical protein ACOX6U_09180 [Oscillospiraceae bacterium]|jgi:Pyruvate/2-oxoacid:ferredoxin oxidoreductase delta subunit
MAEYIEREALLAAFAMTDYPFTTFDNAWEMVEQAPSADVAPVVHGKWEWYQGVIEDDYNLRCSECKKTCNGYYDEEDDMYRYIKSNFCPNCGAKMDLEG